MSTLLSLIGVFRHTNNKFIRIAKQTGASLLPIFHPMMLSPGGANPDVNCITKAAKSRDKKPRFAARVGNLVELSGIEPLTSC
ncbi:hypothetical protein ACM4MD_001364, partial [Shigella flexneri]